ncbi:MAG: WbqC family protein [Microbacter sp.]
MNLESKVCVAATYLGPLSYFAHLLNAKEVWIEQHENYLKQTYRNRCVILAANGIMVLSIPVDKGNRSNCPIRDVRLSTHSDWQTLHWRSIESAYNSSAFFDYYRDDFEAIYQKQWTFLFDFDLQFLETVFRCLDLSPNIRFTEFYEKTCAAEWEDLRYSIVHSSTRSQNVGCAMIPYYQVFHQKFGFIPNLSIIDLLFNMGPESVLILQKMIEGVNVSHHETNHNKDLYPRE